MAISFLAATSVQRILLLSILASRKVRHFRGGGGEKKTLTLTVLRLFASN